MGSKKIFIKVGSKLKEDYFKELKTHLEKVFLLEVLILSFKMDFSFALNHLRSQYLASKIIEEVSKLKKDFSQKWLLIVDFDIYADGLNFIFGQADLQSQIAIISLKRLDPKFYDLSENNDLFLKRIKKEATHELGHLFYLNHCQNPKCVMAFSNSIFDVDKKDENLCQRCQEILQSYLERR